MILNIIIYHNTGMSDVLNLYDVYSVGVTFSLQIFGYIYTHIYICRVSY